MPHGDSLCSHGGQSIFSTARRFAENAVFHSLWAGLCCRLAFCLFQRQNALYPAVESRPGGRRRGRRRHRAAMRFPVAPVVTPVGRASAIGIIVVIARSRTARIIAERIIGQRTARVVAERIVGRIRVWPEAVGCARIRWRRRGRRRIVVGGPVPTTITVIAIVPVGAFRPPALHKLGAGLVRLFFGQGRTGGRSLHRSAGQTSGKQQGGKQFAQILHESSSRRHKGRRTDR